MLVGKTQFPKLLWINLKRPWWTVRNLCHVIIKTAWSYPNNSTPLSNDRSSVVITHVSWVAITVENIHTCRNPEVRRIQWDLSLPVSWLCRFPDILELDVLWTVWRHLLHSVSCDKSLCKTSNVDLINCYYTSLHKMCSGHKHNSYKHMVQAYKRS